MKKLIVQRDQSGKIIKIWDSIADICKYNDWADNAHLSKCIRGKRKSHGGYTWETLDSENYSDGDSNYESLETKSSVVSGDTMELTAKTEKSITSEEEAIEFFEIDLDKWVVDKMVTNAWDVTTVKYGKKTNYQVKLFLSKKIPSYVKDIDDRYEEINKLLKGYTPKPFNINKNGLGTLTVEVSDFHIGAEVSKLTRTLDFNSEILLDYLSDITNIVNSYKAESVVLNMHGDFIETVSGLNHDDTWKSIGKGMYGSNVLIFANEVLSTHFISKIANVGQINMVSGNHDRLSAKKSVDNQGSGAALLAHMLRKDYPEIEINHNPLILVKEIDGINHIILHGDHGVSKRDVGKLIFDYGKDNMFNLVTEGHLHKRSFKKRMSIKLTEYRDVEYVSMDDLNYRKLVLPPIFTGNFFSESIGFATRAGIVTTYNNEKGVPIITDYTL